MVALIGVMLLINLQSAGILESVYWLLSFPVMVFTAQYGVKKALVPCVAALLMSIMIATPTSIFYLFVAIVVGLSYGGGVKAGVNNGILLGVTIILDLVALVITTVILSSIFGYNPAQEVKVMRDTLSSFGQFTNTSQLAIMLVVITYVGSSIMEALVIHLFGHQLLKRLRIKCLPLKSIYEVRYPKILAPICLVLAIAYLLSTFKLFDASLNNYFIVAYTICFIIGVSDGVLVGICYLKQQRNVRLIFLIILACFIPPFNTLLMWFGIYDIWFNIRANLERK